MNKPELLAPAGDMDCFYAAINAGADAIYLGGNEYGARAYASNFSTEELIEAISYAHLYKVKVYLTVNTLVKEKEFEHLVDFLMPIYKAGLDGVIVQDFGVLMEIKEHFPGLELHASTQMCITSKYGANALKEMGVCRVVPARELSLDEIVTIKKETGLALETFIHGAMCYCYSGQCLFSSFLGGRSGNRGRCAGPCRLPYSCELDNSKPSHQNKKSKDSNLSETYPLSLKDMCTVQILPDLIDAGIDSFKIEGRMKNPYYVAGVTSIYRKYIDLYCDKKVSKKHFKIDPVDYNLLKDLYIRTDLLDGYYFRHNGSNMVTMSKPGYSSKKESEFQFIKEQFLDTKKQIPLECEVVLRVNEPVYIQISTSLSSEHTNEACTNFYASETLVLEAQNKPLDEETVKKQINKTGNTSFYFENLSVIMDENCFLPIKVLNECRREALEQFEILYREEIQESFQYRQDISDDLNLEKDRANNINRPNFDVDSLNDSINDSVNSSRNDSKSGSFVVSVLTKEQYQSVVSRIQSKDTDSIAAMVLDWELFLDQSNCSYFGNEIEKFGQCVDFYLSLPSIGREKASELLDQIPDIIFFGLFKGYYCNQFDMVAYVTNRFKNAGMNLHHKVLCGDAGLYIWNHKAVDTFNNCHVSRYVVPLEASRYEIADLKDECEKHQISNCLETLVYGHVPFMQSANCVKKTFGKCDQKREITKIKDRYNKEFPVINRCSLCENTIYNSVPICLSDEYQTIDTDYYRINFTIENDEEIQNIMNLFLDKNGTLNFEYTKGHFKKGIQ